MGVVLRTSDSYRMLRLTAGVFLTISLVPTLQQDQPSAIPGAPGRDYPDFTKVPRTAFTCDGLSPGFYADPEGECQVYHHCTHGSNKPSFTRLCPLGPSTTSSTSPATGGSTWTAAQSRTSTASMMKILQLHR